MDFVKIGVVIGTHGLDGLLRVLPLTENPELIVESEYLMLADGGQVKKSLQVESVRWHKGQLLIEVDGLDDPDAALALKGLDVVLPKHLLPEPEEGELFWKDIEGATVVDENGSEIGVLEDYVDTTGSADCFQIKGADGKTYLVSNNEYHVLSIDAANRRIVVHTSGLVSEDV